MRCLEIWILGNWKLFGIWDLPYYVAIDFQCLWAWDSLQGIERGD